MSSIFRHVYDDLTAKKTVRSPIRDLKVGDGFARNAEEVFWLRCFSAVAGRDRPGRARRSRCLCPDADGRGQIVVLSIAGVVARGNDDCGLAADRVDERPGRRPPRQWNRGDIPELDLGST